MKRAFKHIALAVLAVAFLQTQPAAAELTREQRVADANTIISLFEHRYAPVEWKESFLGIEFDDLVADLIGTAYSDVSDLEFFAAMARFSADLHDSHSWVIIPSKYRVHLGFDADYIDGKVLVKDIDRKQLPEAVFPFERGDELIAIDGQPVEDVIRWLQQFSSEANYYFGQRYSTYELTNRGQSTYPFLPSGTSAVTIRSRSRGTEETVSLEWIAEGLPLAAVNTGTYEEVSEFGPSMSTRQTSIDSGADGETEYRGTISTLERLRWSAGQTERNGGFSMGDSAPFFPLWDTFVKRSDEPLFSGIFLLDGRRIGLVRIPTWSPPDAGAWFRFLDREIPYLEMRTDALIIDQTDNFGGDICLGEAVAGYFLENDSPACLFEARANRHFLLYIEEELLACESGENAEYFSSDDCTIIEQLVFEMRDAIANDKPRTKPIPICSADGMVHPTRSTDGKKIVYTKPVLMLVNERAMSTADMTPAILQDSGRVVMFGTTTAGAGGNVETPERIGHSDFRMSLTESLAVRPKPVTLPDGTQTRYIENVGVIPDVEYSVTVDDFLNGYQGYKAAIEETLKWMLK